MYDSSLDALNAAFDRMEEDKRMLREEGLMAHKNFIVSTCIRSVTSAVFILSRSTITSAGNSNHPGQIHNNSK